MMKNDETNLKGIIISIVEYKKELRKHFILILMVCVSCAVAGLFYDIFYKKDKYQAVLSFIIEDANSSSSVSSFSGIASQFGFDIGGSSSSFSEQNVIELLKSRTIVESALNRKCTINGTEASLLDHYIKINNITEEDNANILFKINEISRDSITTVIWKSIVDGKMDIISQNEEASILNLSYASINNTFPKYFTEFLVEEMSDMYSSHQTEKTRNSLSKLEARADSIFSELKLSEENYARTKDQNIRITRLTGRLDEIRYQREVEVLNTIYLEVIKNTELVKMNLLNETPIIQIVDTPVLPLENIKRSKLFWIVIFEFFGLVFCFFIILLRKLVRDALSEDV